MTEPVKKSKIVVPPVKALQKPNVKAITTPTKAAAAPKPKSVNVKRTITPKPVIVTKPTVKKGITTSELIRRMQLASSDQFK